MGAYLSQPITKKVSSDNQSEHLSYGDSSMQGWRVSQEDAHNSLPDLEPGVSLFAVYDGHGGHEVATYAAQTLPGAIRDCPLYAAGKVRESLRKTFLEFDGTLTRPEIIEKLKAIAGREAESASRLPRDLKQERLDVKYYSRMKHREFAVKEDTSSTDSSSSIEDLSAEDEEETDREVDELFQEAHMPLEEVMARYQGDKPTAPAAGGVAKLKTKSKEKPLSPFLRAKAGGSGGGSSSSSVGSGSGSGSDNDANKDLSTELSDAKSEPSDSTKSESEPDTKPDSVETAAVTDAKSESKSESNSEPAVKSESNSKSPIKSESSSESTTKSNSESEVKSESKTNGSGSPASGEPAAAAAAGSPTDTISAGGDTPTCNGNGTASPGKTSARGKGGKGGKGARPGSGKSPAPAGTAASEKARPGAGRATRQMPERAAAEVYRDVLEGARKAREAGHDHVEDEEEEEEDDDFSLEQSDDDNEADDDDSEEEEEDEEEDQEDSEDDEMGDEEEEEAADEDSDFMFNMKDEPGSDSGCTAVVALLHGRQLYVSNIGDSRCVLSRSGRAVDMSDDHKPEDEPELQRIVKAGGKVTMDGRVNGGLNLSRAFGDHAYKMDKKLPAEEQMISACPDIRCVTIEPGTDEFMVLACDGIWNSKKSQEVVDFVSERIRERGETQLSKICEELFDECLASNTMGDGTGCDNMTCIIVRFLPSLARVKAPTATEEAAADAASSDAGAAPRPQPEGAPPEKRQRTE